MSNMKMLSKTITLICYQATPPTVAECSWSCCQKLECMLNNECLSGNLVYKAAVSQTLSEITKLYYGVYKKKLKRNGTKIILLHLEVKANSKV